MKGSKNCIHIHAKSQVRRHRSPSSFPFSAFPTHRTHKGWFARSHPYGRKHQSTEDNPMSELESQVARSLALYNVTRKDPSKVVKSPKPVTLSSSLPWLSCTCRIHPKERRCVCRLIRFLFSNPLFLLDCRMSHTTRPLRFPHKHPRSSHIIWRAGISLHRRHNPSCFQRQL